MIRSAAGITAIVALIATFAAAMSSAWADTLDARVEAQDVLRQVNHFRVAQQRVALAIEPHLTAAAQAFAQYMAQHERYGHDADGREPEQRAQAHGYAFCIVAENIAYRARRPPFAGGELAAELVAGWRDSPPHLHNILNGNVTDTGVGLAQGASGRWYAVQMFGRPEWARIVFDVRNDTASTITYRLDAEVFQLDPRSSRTHEDCASRKLVVLQGKEGVAQVEATQAKHYRVIVNSRGAPSIE